MRALTFCKIGNLDQETFDIMKERFPVWAQKMLDQMLIYKKTLLRDLSFFKEEASLNMLDSTVLKSKIIDEKLIEHYYPVFQKFEKEEMFEEKKNEKVIKGEIDLMKSSSRKNREKDTISIRNETKETLISGSGASNKRQNIVHLMNQSYIILIILY